MVSFAQDRCCIFRSSYRPQQCKSLSRSQIFIMESKGINTDYAISVPAIVKYCEMVFSILTFAIAAGSAGFQVIGGGWVVFVGVLGFLVALAFFLFYLFSVYPDFMVNYMIEPIVNAVMSIFYLIAGIVAATRAGQYYCTHCGASSFFAFLCMVIFALDAVIIFLNNRSSAVPRTSGTTTTNPTAPPEYAGQNAVY